MIEEVGQPSITIYGDYGLPIGAILPSGKWLRAAPSGVGTICVGYRELTAQKEVLGMIVWDGGSKIPLTDWQESKVPGGPRCRIMPYPNSPEGAGSES